MREVQLPSKFNLWPKTKYRLLTSIRRAQPKYITSQKGVLDNFRTRDKLYHFTTYP